MEKYLKTEKKILSSGINLEYGPNKFLFREGQDLNHIFYLVDGEVELSSKDSNLIIKPKNKLFFGINDLENHAKHSFNLQTKSYSQFLIYEKSFFISLLEEYDDAKDYYYLKLQDFFNSKEV